MVICTLALPTFTNHEMIQNNLETHKNTFRFTIDPMIQLLEHKRTLLNLAEWIQFVESTKARIIDNPEQYLGKDLPNKKIIKQSIEMIFEEMIEDQSILNS